MEVLAVDDAANDGRGGHLALIPPTIKVLYWYKSICFTGEKVQILPKTTAAGI